VQINRHVIKHPRFGKMTEAARCFVRVACISGKIRNAVRAELKAHLETGVDGAHHALELLDSDAGAVMVSRAAEGLNERVKFMPAPCPGLTLNDPWLPENAALLVLHLAQTAIQRLMRGEIAWFEIDDTFTHALRLLKSAPANNLPFTALPSHFDADHLPSRLPLELCPLIQPNAPSA
jgi:hypothetical protein